MRDEARENISNSLKGRFGEESRRWKGDKSGYVSKHLWLSKHYDKEKCEHCGKLHQK